MFVALKDANSQQGLPRIDLDQTLSEYSFSDRVHFARKTDLAAAIQDPESRRMLADVGAAILTAVYRRNHIENGLLRKILRFFEDQLTDRGFHIRPTEEL